MSSYFRAVAQSCELTNAHTNPPQNGTQVWALTKGGKLVEMVWNETSHKMYFAWCPYPKIPDDVKALLLAQYPLNALVTEAT